MEATFHSGSALEYGIMGDEQICIQRELRQSVSLARTVELLPGHIVTVNGGVCHRTRPVGAPSVNLTIERTGARKRLASPRDLPRSGSCSIHPSVHL